MGRVPAIHREISDTLEWRKSRFSRDGNECVESCRPAGGLIAFRDSKAPDAGTLVITAGQGRALMERIREGAYDPPALG
ncbi:DUF397 domain-containing protein [Actinomadura napierensis]|uniref:DUF397 domain-containing protein n=1 Tax=Actinomadura napierensis TaxID=267854 RepID=A0ABP5KTK5_9ACTN